MKKACLFIEIFLIMIFLQGVRELFEWLIVVDSDFYKRMVTMTIMIVLTVLFVFYALFRKTKLSVFPERFGKSYIIITCLFVALLISCPSNYSGGFEPVLLLIYGSVVTPIYEELIFRGYFWNRMNNVSSKEIYTYIWSVVFFTIWHLGYMMGELMAGNYVAVLWKLLAGLGYGIVLGFVRLKTKNCYSTMLLHGALNVFMI